MDDQTLHETITRLYPLPSRPAALHGLYLDHRLHSRGNPDRPFVYSNFVTSLDGRIGIESMGRTTHTVPDAIANPRDWRLYQELAGQADILAKTDNSEHARGHRLDRLGMRADRAFGNLCHHLDFQKIEENLGRGLFDILNKRVL